MTTGLCTHTDIDGSISFQCQLMVRLNEPALLSCSSFASVLTRDFSKRYSSREFPDYLKLQPFVSPLLSRLLHS